MKRLWKQVLFVLVAFLIPLWVFGDPPVYYAKDIRGQVVDAETGQPLEGVIVVARWMLRSAGPGSNSPGISINTIEVVTDKEGKYFIPGWGPRPRLPLHYLDYDDPALRFFKSDFYPQSLSNTFRSDEHHNKRMVRTSEWDTKVIKLMLFGSNDWSDYSFRLEQLWSSETMDCVRECPRFVLALDAESKRIKAFVPKGTFYPMVLDIENFSDRNREFLKRFKDGTNLP